MAEPPLTEAQWQARVIDCARWHRWWVFHVGDSRTVTEAGWPDLVLIHDEGRALFVELKTARGQLRPTQVACLARLRMAGLETHVWRPVDWPQVMRVLARDRGGGP